MFGEKLSLSGEMFSLLGVLDHFRLTSVYYVKYTKQILAGVRLSETLLGTPHIAFSYAHFSKSYPLFPCLQLQHIQRKEQGFIYLAKAIWLEWDTLAHNRGESSSHQNARPCGIKDSYFCENFHKQDSNSLVPNTEFRLTTSGLPLFLPPNVGALLPRRFFQKK